MMKYYSNSPNIKTNIETDETIQESLPFFDTPSLIRQKILDIMPTLNSVDLKPKVVEQFVVFFHEIRNALRAYSGQEVQKHVFPKMAESIEESGTLFAEWIFKSFRLGFFFDETPETSSYFLVSDSTMKSISVAGSLDPDNIHNSIQQIIKFVMENT